MAVSKRTVREDLSQRAADRLLVTTSAAGDADGGTFVVAGLAGKQAEFYQGFYPVARTDAAAPKWSQITTHDENATAITFTVRPKFGAQIGSGVVIELHAYRPDLFTTAMNLARIRGFAARHFYKGLFDSTLVSASATWEYTLPTGVTPDQISRVMLEGIGDFAGIPREDRLDYTFSPSGKLWFGRADPNRYWYLPDGKKIYLIGAQPVTAFAEDTTPFVLATDNGNTDLAVTDLWYELYLLYAKAALYELIAADDRDPKWGTLAEQVWKQIARDGGTMAMAPPERNSEGW
jgi:hypothetical protein